MIEVERLSKSYGPHPAVRDVSFRIGQGEVVGFLGPNGAGKSTTLRMITGLLAPSGGRVVVDGKDVLTDPHGVQRRIGYMPEGVPLYREMRVAEYLRYRAALKGVAAAERAACVARALERADVVDVAGRIIAQLSKGYRQRVGLADALVADPPILILDEPTAGLDPNQIRKVRQLIRELAGSKTVLLSTHILPEVEAACERVLIVNKGRLVGEGTAQSLRPQARAGESLRVVCAGGATALRKALQAVPEVTQIRPDESDHEAAWVDLEGGQAASDAVFLAMAEAGLPAREFRPANASLEHVFAQLTTEPPSSDQEST